MIKLEDEILFLAFRYALGRKTSVTFTVSDAIIKNWEVLSIHFQYLIQKEIAVAINEGRAGMQMDIEQWERILKLE